MNHPTPTITVNVDVTNPGQFFACCGLLELADRLWPGAEAWFEDQTFHLHCNCKLHSVDDLIIALLQRPEFQEGRSKKQALGGSKQKLLPFFISFPTSILRIDWWRDELSLPKDDSRESCGKSTFKTWAGNQSPHQIVYEKLLPPVWRIAKSSQKNLFYYRAPLTGRFGFDHTAAVTSLDAGWSPNALKLKVQTSPAIELLAMIGLQRFRPKPVRGEAFVFHPWSTPLPVGIAPLLVANTIPDRMPYRGFAFSILERGDYKYFSSATPIHGDAQ